MELPEIGLQCSQSDCKQLDFLPLQCKSCGKQFCTEHFNVHSKTCQQNLTLDDDEIQDRKITQTFKCSKEQCNETSIVPLICEKCLKHFCVKHRHIVNCSEKTAQEIQAEKELFNAPIRQFNAAKDKVDKQIEDSLNQAKKKGQHKEQMAIKVQLMKIKNKAVGLKSVPTSDRVYFNVHFSSRKNPEEEILQQRSNGLDLTKFDRTLPVFVSRNWTLGRTIDAIAQECSLTNNNNKSAERKLRLFKKDGGDMVSKNMADVLSKLLDDKSMIDGENLIIEYVDDSCDRL